MKINLINNDWERPVPKLLLPVLTEGQAVILRRVLSVNCGVHNHLVVEHLEGYYFAGRLSKKEENLIVDMFKTLVWSRDILHTLKQINNLNVSTVRTIYNVRRKNKVVEYVERSQMYQLMNHLSKHTYIEVHKRCPDTETVKVFFGLTRLSLSYCMHFRRF